MGFFARALVVGTSLACASTAARAGDPKGTVVEGDLGARLDEAVKTVGGKSLWGAVLVAKGGQVLLAKGYGFADYEKRGNAPDTFFEIASTTKQFTAAAVLRLEQQGKLKTTDSLERFFGSKVPADKRKVTVQHLLNHTAGLDPSLGVPYSWAGSRDQYVPKMLEAPLVSEPGEKFSYSNVGYALLAAVVEVASGKSFEDCSRKELFAPAGLKDTGFVKDPVLVRSDRVSARRAEDSEPDWTAANWFWGWGYRGMGGVVTTVLDLHRWDRALRGDKVLGAEAKRKMFLPALEGYACGWKVETTERGTTKVHHSGGVRGYACQYARWLEDDAVVAILSNGKSDLFAIERAIVSLLFAEPKVEVRIDAGKNPLSESRSVRTTEARFEAKRDGDRLVVRLVLRGHALATARLPVAYGRKIAAELEAALAGRQDREEPATMDAGIYFGAYEAGTTQARVEEDVSVEVLARYPGAAGAEELPCFVVIDRRNRFWPVLVKMNGAAAEALLAIVRGASK